MSNLFQTLEDTAARGAAGLTAEARGALAQAVSALQTSDGGFAGLDGRSDMYFSLFAWLSLRALKVPFDRGRLCAYAETQVRESKGVDAQCGGILLACEGRRSRGTGWLALGNALLRGEASAVYGAFLLALGTVPRWAARWVWRSQRKMFAAELAERLPTPRLAAGLVLATLAGASCGTGLLPALLARQCAGGGFRSAPGAPADLLATAVARFACGFGSRGRSPSKVSSVYMEALSSRARDDLALIEACWLDDGLFGASPQALRGDAEHTFYALLALGTCRPDHS